MFEHILSALDGSQHDTKTLAATKELAKLSGAQVRVLHVREGHFIGRAGIVPSEEHDHAARIVDQAVADLGAQRGIDWPVGLAFRTHLDTGGGQMLVPDRLEWFVQLPPVRCMRS